MILQMNDDQQTKLLKQIRSNTTIMGLILLAILLTQLASCAMKL